MTGRMPEPAPEHAPEQTPDGVPDHVPDHLPDHVPDHVALPQPKSLKRVLFTALQFILLAALLALIAREVASQADELRATAANLTINWWMLLAASIVVLLTHASLIQSWRLLTTGWGSSLRFGAAVRIWTIANLGRYVPGKLWSVGALVVLAQREGVNPVAATGSAMIGTLLNIGAGFGVVALTGASVLEAMNPSYRWLAWLGSAVFVLGVLALPSLLPPVLAWISRTRPNLSSPTQQLPNRTLWTATVINIASWFGYGLAFAFLSRAVFPDIGGAIPTFVAIWTASYLVGYLFLILPGGIGVREGAMVAGFGALGLAVSAEATVLAIVSRLWLTLLEVLPGLISLALTPALKRVRS